MIKLLLFGRLKFEFGGASAQVDRFEAMPVGQFRRWLEGRSEFSNILVSGQYLVAVNQRVALDSDRVSPEDEIALFPPVTGG